MEDFRAEPVVCLSVTFLRKRRPAELSAWWKTALPYFLSFAAGAMLYVVVEELIPEVSQGRHSNIGTVFFAVGFSIMMTLDVALG